MKSIINFFIVTFFSGFVVSSAFAVNTDDPNLSQNAGGAAMVSGAVISGVSTCEPTKECSGPFQSGPRQGSDWSRLLPGEGTTVVPTNPAGAVDTQPPGR